MLIKKSEIIINSTEIYPLNVPDLSKMDYIRDAHVAIDNNIVNDVIGIIKSAEKTSSFKITGDDANFDLEAEIKKHPDSLFVKCFAIKADEVNDNGDFFCKKELIKATPTFIGVPVFTNHQNNDVEKSRGRVVYSWWDEKRNGIMVIMRVDAVAYPQLARGIKEKYIISTSMGCSVSSSCCSVCHNAASVPAEYCSCIKERKTRKVSQKNVKCQYHVRGTEDKCPLCGSEKDDAKTFDVHDQKVFEHNYGIKFIENSCVVNPACHDCGITEIIDVEKFISKVAEIQSVLPALLKEAASIDVMCTDRGCVKLAGQQEIQDLNQALELVSSVSKKMLDQKAQIDLEFLSDLVTVLADLQSVTDELIEQGYGRLPSAPDDASADQSTSTSPDATAPTPTMPAPTAVGTNSPATSNIYTGPAGDVGKVTGPSAGAKSLSLDKIGNLLNKYKHKKLILSQYKAQKTKDIDTKNNIIKISMQISNNNTLKKKS